MSDSSTAHSKWPLVVVIATAALMIALLELHTPHLNGPEYGVVYYRRLPPIRTYGVLIASALPTLLAVAIWPRVQRGRWLLLLLPTIGAFTIKIVSAMMLSKTGWLDFVTAVVLHEDATSYYIDAGALSNFPGWLADFPQLMPMLHLHSMTKAPGMILYYSAFIHTLGYSPHTATVAGVTLGAIATFSIPTCFLFLRALGHEATEAFLGACFLSLCPGYLFFFPQADPAYPVIACAMGACWAQALKRDSIGFAIGLGVAISVMLVVSFNLLVLGAFFIAYALLATGYPIQKAIKLALKHAAIAGTVCVALMLILHFTAGYNPKATLESAITNQNALLAKYGMRPYPRTIWNDLIDFVLGSGWICVPLTALAVARGIQEGWKAISTRTMVLCVSQFVLVAVTGLLASETARVWNFMYPLLMFPVALQLSRHTRNERLIVFTCLAVIAACDFRNLSFIF